ncbi:SDR family NAD(P)-dependent oxidoreductase [Roseivirga sp. BDSF3-8]|uniref:SDR family NAD(P)-dependent oxidoreductase n=1 Tax=Roseivirga sp. BDSF3-8 TaxID=3241598 RepID=UPI0035323CE3
MDYYFITGTSQGLGRALVEEALKRGGRVHGLSRSEPADIDSLRKREYVHFSYDLSDLQGLEAFAAEFFKIPTEANSVILINNAGTLGEVSHIGEWDNTDLIKAFATNLTAPAVLQNTFLKLFGEKALGKIVINISSGASKSPYDGWSAYCSGKAGLEMYSRVLAEEAKKKSKRDTRVWSVAPGVVDTGMQDRLRESDPDQFSNLDRFLSLKEEGKLMPPSESAAKIFMLLEHPERSSDTVQDIRNF